MPGEPSLADTHPDLAAQANGWDPKMVIAGSHKKLEWVCGSGHNWTTSPSKRSARSQGCPYCSGNLVIVGETDLATTHPLIAAQADGWDPTVIKAGSHKKLGWNGLCGHKWTADVASRAFNGNGCPYCANLRILIGFNDLATTHPEIATQAYGWDPTTLSINSNKKSTINKLSCFQYKLINCFYNLFNKLIGITSNIFALLLYSNL